MARVPSTPDLILEIRDQAAEYNIQAKSDDAIIRIMNRGLRFVASELARSWEIPLVARAVYSPVGYDPDDGLPYPADIFEDRITYVQVETPSAPTNVKFRGYTQVTALQIRGSKSFIPVAAYQKGHALFLVPTPGSAYNILVDYVRLPDPFVRPIGRVTAIDLIGDAVSVSDLQTDLVSADVTSQLAYVNLVDGMSGVVYATRQVQLVQGSRLGFRAAPSRAIVEGRTVSGSFAVVEPEVPETSPEGPDQMPKVGDYVCPVDGTCVPQFGSMLVNFVVQYAVAEIARSLGDTTAAIGKQIADRGEQAARQQKAGHPNIMRVKNRSGIWGVIRPSAYPFVQQP